MGSAGGRGTGDTGDAGASTKVSDAMLKSMVRKVARGPNRLRPAAASYPLFWLGSKRLSKSSKAANPFPNVVRPVPFANTLLNKPPTGAAGEKTASPLIGADTLPMVISADAKLEPPTYELGKNVKISIRQIKAFADMYGFSRKIFTEHNRNGCIGGNVRSNRSGKEDIENHRRSERGCCCCREERRQSY